MDEIIGLEVTQNSISFSFADEVIAWAFSNFSKIRLLRFFYARGRLSKCLVWDGYSSWFVVKFSNKEKWFTNLVGDEMPNLRPYCFGRSCLSVEMLQWFVVFDFVHNSQGEILKQLWSFFANSNSLLLSRYCEETAYAIRIFTILVQFLAVYRPWENKVKFEFRELAVFFFSLGRYCFTVWSDERSIDWRNLKRVGIKNKRIRLNVSADTIFLKLQKWRTQDEINYMRVL